MKVSVRALLMLALRQLILQCHFIATDIAMASIPQHLSFAVVGSHRKQ